MRVVYLSRVLIRLISSTLLIMLVQKNLLKVNIFLYTKVLSQILTFLWQLRSNICGPTDKSVGILTQTSSVKARLGVYLWLGMVPEFLVCKWPFYQEE